MRACWRPGLTIHQPVHEIPPSVPVHTVITGGMPGWQITVIMAAAGVLAAALAVLATRKRAARLAGDIGV
jgi:hypothetical protein